MGPGQQWSLWSEAFLVDLDWSSLTRVSAFIKVAQQKTVWLLLLRLSPFLWDVLFSGSSLGLIIWCTGVHIINKYINA